MVQPFLYWMWRGLSKSEIFPGFLGNTRIVQSLFRSISAGTLSSTLLFTGPEGSGKKTLAQKVVELLFCPKLCRNCKNCTMLAQRTHPDFLLLSPEGSTLKLEQAKELQAFLATPPNTAGHKVAVVESCHLLTVEAGNSLLKILEEPPGQSICILTADNPDNVLPTLVSRSQVYILSSLPDSILREALAERVPPEQVAFLAGFSGGVFGRALALHEDPDFWQCRKALGQEVQGVLLGRRDPLLTAESWQPLSDRFLDLLEFWLRDMLMLQTVKGYSPINGDLVEELAECTSVCPREKTVMLLQECAEARERLRVRCNPRLVFDGLLLKMWEV